jgi:hypothetical protein
MKYLILFLFSLSAHANFIGISGTENCATVYTKLEYCQAAKGECVAFPEGETCEVLTLKDVAEDDLSKPIRNKTEVEACDGEADCQEKLAQKSCLEKFINADYSEVYCSQITGYEQMTVKKLVVDAVKKAQKDARDAAKKSVEDKIALGRIARNACQSVLDLIAGSNVTRELTAEQITLMQSTFGDIERALQSNRPNLAKSLIAQVPVDGVIVTEELKAVALELLKDF